MLKRVKLRKGRSIRVNEPWARQDPLPLAKLGCLMTREGLTLARSATRRQSRIGLQNLLGELICMYTSREMLILGCFSLSS